ncbi:epithelial cell-transforming sequence 2 oncogene-like isoform X1 [Tachyglossus aculeatus]|uniref:epithelial cell-transforming sequence 2 oncogene-like isoform X1 n=1 Tax=Tachyglossus aculeatus TaxID=9261 RepID=UPI0018F3E0AB|nr:epithelial cell-transforming sequence 2 oncogene-like isoform X1 [Tachyglossus aculeatus]XP_038623836.1 epithelial cell-transforming sequence 2 oncogene-like isoform X1 [Tachyglossus aculeatus]XP_038623843.1 epithelial cell-transforming sequence 2 oncogene-like isoform X1 [Tachyglossus aculeatus]XP_038623853.1 epithelial cell-transforming sequence 2 oncogene-like isoform X1 [Tachyglossus aculeatus]
MSARELSGRSQATEGLDARFSAWTPLINKPCNKQLFQERVGLISHWFDLWTDKQRKEFLHTILLKCSKSQLRFTQGWLAERIPASPVDFSTVLPRFISLFIFSFLNPKDLCAAAQVNWHWKFLTEQDGLWRRKCIKLGWFLPYTPAVNEYAAWKRHYIACVATLDWLSPREATAICGTGAGGKAQQEEGKARQGEKRLRKMIWKRMVQRRRELFRIRPPWVSGTCCHGRLKSGVHPRLSQATEESMELSSALEKRLVLESVEALPKRKNVAGSHSYPQSTYQHQRVVYQDHDTFSRPAQPFLVLISSRIPAFEMVVDSVKAGVVPLLYEHTGMTLESLFFLVEKALDGRKARSIGIFCDGDSREINLLQGCKIGVKNVLNAEVKEFWRKLGNCVVTAEEGGHVDLFVPLAASDVGMELLSQLAQLAGASFRTPAGIATGSYQRVFSDWLGQKPGQDPPATYFSEVKLHTWNGLAELVEETLQSVRKQLRPHFKELQKNLSGRIIGQFLFDSLSVARVKTLRETAGILVDGLVELSKEKSENPLEFLSYFLLKKGQSRKDREFGDDAILTECDPEATLNSLLKEGNVIEDHSRNRKASTRENELKFEVLVELERKLQEDAAEKRTKVVGELLKSERTYVQVLEIVRDVYVAPLKAAVASNRAILSAANIHIIFSDILGILELNSHFLDELTGRLQEWGPAQCVGEIFTKFGSQLHTYTSFLNNYSVILKSIDKCRERIPSFRAFLKRHDQTIATKMMSLQELLLYPPKRFEEYINLLYALRLHTPSDHADREDLTTAIEQIRKYRGFIDQLKQNVNKKDQMLKTQRIISGCPTLSEDNRYLIRVQDVAQLRCCDEDIIFSLRLYEHVHDLSLFLFNDALVVSSRGISHSPFERASKTTYRFSASVALPRLFVEDIPDSPYVKNAFILQAPTRQWICSTEVEDDKFAWLSVLQRAIKSAIEK